VSNTKRKFIESHWLTFAAKGVLSTIAGLCIMFAPKSDGLDLITQIVGWTMFGLAMVEILNVLYRKKKSHNWGFPLVLGLIELGIAVGLLFSLSPNASAEELFTIRISLLSAYVAFASIVTIAMGFVSFENMTDRFMWVVNGMLGCVIAAMMFGGTNLGQAAHIELFGTYLMVNGITDLFFGVHSKDEMVELRASRKVAAKKGKK
jgi:uncharacterized membrane protein HdeD (DUF308 family)